jgi:hypothetical protein
MSEISWNTSLQKKKHGQPGAVLAAFCSFSFSSSSGRLVSSLSQIPFPIVSSAPLQDLGARGASPANTISLPAPHLAHQTAITPSETPRALGSSRVPSPREPSRFPLSLSARVGATAAAGGGDERGEHHQRGGAGQPHRLPQPLPVRDLLRVPRAPR